VGDGSAFDKNYPVPEVLASRPRDRRGYPIPHGVWQNPQTGEWDFRVIVESKRLHALEHQLCAVSGAPMEPGEYWFVGGPSCFRDRLFIDGPMRREVAEYSLKVCPHLAIPSAQYRSAGTEGHHRPAEPSEIKMPVYLLAMAASYSVEMIDGTRYIRAGEWKRGSWWRGGQQLAMPEVDRLLREAAASMEELRSDPEQ
jgi:hypothetical protein